MNSFNVVARLGQDAELRHLPSGTPVVSFRAAFDDGYGDKKVTTWISCGIIGNRATEKLCAALTKGTQVALTGPIKIQEWQTQSGEKRQDLKLTVMNLSFIGSRAEPAGGGGSSRPNSNPAGGQGAGMPPHSQDEFEDSIPF